MKTGRWNNQKLLSLTCCSALSIMAPIEPDIVVHLRSDRSITQMMLENTSNTDPDKRICEDVLTGKAATYGSLRNDAFKSAHALRHRFGMQANDIVTIIGRSCVSRTSNAPDLLVLTETGRLYYRSACHLGRRGYRQVRLKFLIAVPRHY